MGQAAAAARWDRWGESNHIGIHAAVMARAVSPDGATFTAPPDIEVVKAWGVHGAAPLPPNAAWRVTLDAIGSHAAVGVVSSRCHMMAHKPCFLLGYGPDASQCTSWGICTGTEAGGHWFLAAHNNAFRPWLQHGSLQLPVSSQGNPPAAASCSAAAVTQPLEIRLRLEDGRKLYATVPATGAAEQLVFEIQTDFGGPHQLFASAATTLAGSKITIEGLEEDMEVEGRAAAQQMSIVVHPTRPAAGVVRTNAGRGSARTAATPEVKAHQHSWGVCRVCPRCHRCTGYGDSCVKVHGKPDRGAEAGGPCGCGEGEAGCQRCVMCVACCAAVAAADALAAAAKAGPSAASPTSPVGGCHGKLPDVPKAREKQASGGGVSGQPSSSSGPLPPLPPLPTPFAYPVTAPFSLLELTIMQLAGAIRDKPNWSSKLKDPVVSGRWRSEAAAQGASEEVVAYVWQMLEHESGLTDGQVTQGAVPGVITADGLVPSETLLALVQEVARLEALPPDWHPGSNEQVLDLVHPSLFSLVFGVSRQLPERTVTLANCLDLAGAGKAVAPPLQAPATRYAMGSRLHDQSVTSQWLPTNFDIDAQGKATIHSYINNLHPRQYARLYGVLARIFELALPMLGQVLGALSEGLPPPRVIDPYKDDWYDQEDEPSYDDPGYNEWYENREVRPPSVPETFVSPPRPAPMDLHGRPLQVIVKLANIQLTPENPRYPGGAWHVEGMKNERIVASAIYYFSQENVTDSQLAFRVPVDEPDYEQSDEKGVRTVFGLEDEGALNQVLGAVTTLPGRVLCFPNTYQHQVQPFELVDKTKPGHRKILVYFLVDPSQRVLSTSEVPPQQSGWWRAEVFADNDTRLAGVPPEVRQVIGDMFDHQTECPYSRAVAERHRSALMTERKFYVDRQNEEHFEREFSLCEH